MIVLIIIKEEKNILKIIMKEAEVEVFQKIKIKKKIIVIIQQIQEKKDQLVKMKV